MERYMTEDAVDGNSKEQGDVEERISRRCGVF
jgi:hypothetical protein